MPSLSLIFIVLFVDGFVTYVESLRLVLYFEFKLLISTRCSFCEPLFRLLQLFSPFILTFVPQTLRIKTTSPQIDLKVRLFEISASAFEQFELCFKVLRHFTKWNSGQVLLFNW